MKKIIKLASLIAVSVGYCVGMGFGGYNAAYAQGDGISQPYFGRYNLNGMQSTRYCLFLNSATESLFEGEYSGRGTVACSDLDPNSIVFAPNDFVIGGENFNFK